MMSITQLQAMNFLYSNFLIIVWSLIFLFPAGSIASTLGDLGGKSKSASERPWCHLNPVKSLPGEMGEILELPNENIFIIKKEKQAWAKNRLKDKIFLKLSSLEAASLDPGWGFVDKEFYYLIRATAAFDDEENYSSRLRLAGAFYTDTNTLNLYSFFLMRPETPLKNIAVLLKISVFIKKVNVICLTAS